MSERVVVIGSAVFLAGVVFFLTLMSEPSAPVSARRTTIDDPIHVDLLTGFDPDRPQFPISPRGAARKYRLSSLNSRGQLIELYGATLDPLPDGVARVTEPGARVHLAPQRILQITAQQGTILAPDNQVRSGEFSGDVLLTLFEASAGRSVDLSEDSDDAGLNLYLRDARFDLELGRIESDKEVRLVGSQIEFLGTGLDLNYNALHHRIDRLEIASGKLLRFVPVVEGSDPEAEVVPVGDAAVEDDPSADGSGVRLGEGGESLSDGADPRPVQYYRARFEDSVSIRREGVTIEADRLEVVFSVQSQGALGGLAPQAGGDPVILQAGVPGVPFDFDMALGVGVPRVVLMRLASLVPAYAGDGSNSGDEMEVLTVLGSGADAAGAVMITWSGRLLVEPEESPPLDITGPDDFLLELVGSPVWITTDRNEVITAASVDYLSGEGRVRMIGTAKEPLVIDSPGLGVLRAKRLELYERLGTGQIVGGGSLTAVQQAAEVVVDASSGEMGEAAASGSGDFDITWQDRVDLTFASQGSHLDDEDGTGGEGGVDDAGVESVAGGGHIQAIERADFYGDVHVRHPRFALDTDQFSIALTAVDDGGQSVDQVSAVGGVHVTAGGSPGQPPLDIHCDQLEVGFADRREGRVESTRVVADGNVDARQPGRALQADHMEIDLAWLPEQADEVDAVAVVPEAEVEQTTETLQARSFADEWLVDAQTADDVEDGGGVAGVGADGGGGEAEDVDDDTQLAEGLGDQDMAGLEEGAVDHELAVGGTADLVSTTRPADSSAEVVGEVYGSRPVAHEEAAAGDELSDGVERYAVRTFMARGGVRIGLDAGQVRIAADRLEADVSADQIELYGTEEQDAEIEHPDGVLSAGHLVLNQAGQSVHVSGPGSLVFYSGVDTSADQAEAAEQEGLSQEGSSPEPGVGVSTATDDLLGDGSSPPVVVASDADEVDLPALPAVAAVADARDATVTVTWVDAMHFDNRYGLAQFLGGVVSEASTDDQTTRLSADDVRLELTELPDRSSSALSESGGEQDGEDRLGGLARGGRAVRMMTARDNVVFLSTKWAGGPDAPDRGVETRMRVSGPLVSFDSIMEQVQVIGPGRMLLEDYRVRSEERRRDPGAAALFGVERTGQVRFTGRGATLMRWKGQLVLDAFHNDMRVETDVQMVHRSRDSQLSVQMDCSELLADLATTGGLGAWLAADAVQPSLQAVYADHDVRVVSDERVIRTDHLEFTAFDQTILLRADKGRMTTIHEQGQPTALTAERFRWDLSANRLEVLRPGPIRMPVER